MTPCPKGEKSSTVDRTVRPVTQQALVAVNAASTRVIGGLAGARAAGRASKPVPIAIAPRYVKNDQRAE